MLHNKKDSEENSHEEITLRNGTDLGMNTSYRKDNVEIFLRESVLDSIERDVSKNSLGPYFEVP